MKSTAEPKDDINTKNEALVQFQRRNYREARDEDPHHKWCSQRERKTGRKTEIHRGTKTHKFSRGQNTVVTVNIVFKIHNFTVVS